MPLDYFSLWQAGQRALENPAADEDTRAVWAALGKLLERRPPAQLPPFLRSAATTLDGLGTLAGRSYAAVCDSLADAWDDDRLSEEALLDLVRRLQQEQVPPQARVIGKLLHSLGVIERAPASQQGVLSLGLSLLSAPREKRLSLAAAFLVALSPMEEDLSLRTTARTLTEALLQELTRQWRGRLS
ncbi:MAG: hypothetical protein D6755_13475 [Anaerolineae bacterium]|nr:MAG: hypothetical protein D6755_13475 [Anaerolineae bacterium]